MARRQTVMNSRPTGSELGALLQHGKSLKSKRVARGGFLEDKPGTLCILERGELKR